MGGVLAQPISIKNFRCLKQFLEDPKGMNFEYSNDELIVNATRLEKPPRMDEINYDLRIYSQDDNLNIDLLKRNIEKFGTIFNTGQSSYSITGEIKRISE